MPITEFLQANANLPPNPFARKNDSAIIKKFVTPSSNVSGAGNGITSLDDPTYLGFSLRFDISSPLFSAGTIAPPAPNTLPISADFQGTGEGVATVGPAPPPPRNSNLPKGETAVGYLTAIGEDVRANYLKQFIQGIREINDTRPYYWQTIEGLTEAWGKTFDMVDPFLGSGDGEGIVIGCLEAVDLKISALFNLYKAAVYDSEYTRFILPRNLMRFKVEVDVYEIRRFKATSNILQKLNPNTPPNDVDRFLNDNTSKITFIFDECVWIPAESGRVYGSVTNAGGNEMAMTGMKWSYSSLSMKSDFAGIDTVLSDASKKQAQGGLGAAVGEAAKQAALKAAGAAADRAARAVRAAAQGFALGNAFGLRNQIFAALQNPGALVNAVEGALLTRGASPGNNVRLGDNILGEGISPSNSLPTGNLLVGQIPQINTNLETSNIFGSGPSGPPPLTSNNVFG
jgi:hypothetical protein